MEIVKRKTHLFFSGSTWKHFRKNKPALISLYILATWMLIALLAPVIANDKPLFVKYNGRSFFPAFSFSNTIEIKKDGFVEILQADHADWDELKPEKMIRAPIPFSPGRSSSRYADYFPPSKKHLLGTTKNGSDVLSGLIHGTRISLSIGILSMVIASLIGIFLGAIAGYFGDYRIRVSRGNFLMTLIGIFPAYFYAFYIRKDVLANTLINPGYGFIQFLFSLVIFIFFLFIFYKAGKLLNRIKFFSKKIFFHADSFISRSIEIFISIPRLILIISLAAISRPSFINIVVIIGITSWTEIARFIRAELLQARNAEYIETARAIGLSDFRIIRKHALPNALAPATVAIVFGIASAILIESGLSFLGIGVPQDVTTWGSLLFAGKENYEAWWLVVFPGLAIFITVTAFNLVGDGLRDAMDVRTRIF
jgi:peptide/nickel transport system permease protein